MRERLARDIWKESRADRERSRLNMAGRLDTAWTGEVGERKRIVEMREETE